MGGIIRTMYAVSRGDYSDYGVLCLCESEQVANRIAKKVGSRAFDESFVESFVVVDESVSQDRVLRISQVLWDDGSEKSVREFIDEEWPWDSSTHSCRWRWVRAPSHKDKGGRLEVNGSDHERVRKVFTEKRTILKANPALAAITEATGTGIGSGEKWEE